MDTYSEDDPTLLELFPAEDIHRRSVNLMNLDLDRRVTAVNRPSRPVDGESWRLAGRTLFSSEETDSC